MMLLILGLLAGLALANLVIVVEVRLSEKGKLLTERLKKVQKGGIIGLEPKEIRLKDKIEQANKEGKDLPLSEIL